MAATVRRPTIKVPADKVRTPEQILADARVIRGYVWVICYNCGGRGTYPSGMTPPGMCRLYCWAKPHTDPIAAAMGAMPPHKDRDDPTYGRRPIPVEKYVKEEQAADRREYRASVRFEAERPAREAAQAAYWERVRREQEEREAEQARRAEDAAARKAVSRFMGQIGDRVEASVTLVSAKGFDSAFGRRMMYRFRTDEGNVLVWWTSGGPGVQKGATVRIKGTVKQHSEYDGEQQTTLLRVKVSE